MADVFLSYARQNAVIARRIAETLRKSGYSVWFDEQLPAHRPYSDVIAAELESAAGVVVIWSHAAAQSQWVRSEANRAREKGTLVQTRADDVRLPMPFDQIQCANLQSWKGDEASSGWQSVITSVAALVHSDSAAAVSSDAVRRPRGPTRRTLLATGGAASLASVAGFAVWRTHWNDETSPQAEVFLQKGVDAFRDADILEPDDPQSVASAIGFFSAATHADPKSATAWGALSLAYAAQLRVVPPAERAALEMRSRSAARTALSLNPKEPRALGAIRLLDPVYRHWLSAERADRAALRENPTHSMLLAILGWLLGDVGRWAESARLFKTTDADILLNPAPTRKLILILWSTQDLEGADDMLRKAIEYWPDHPQIWRTRASYLMHSGRTSEALALLQSAPPEGVSPGYVSSMQATAKALASILSAAVAVSSNLEYLKRSPRAVFQVAHACAALGALDIVISLLGGYYFGEGEWRTLAP